MPDHSLGVNSSIARRFLIKANETAFGINFQVVFRGTYSDFPSLIRLEFRREFLSLLSQLFLGYDTNHLVIFFSYRFIFI